MEPDPPPDPPNRGGSTVPFIPSPRKRQSDDVITNPTKKTIVNSASATLSIQHVHSSLSGPKS